MQQLNNSEQKKWDIRLLVISIISMLIFSCITFYLTNMSTLQFNEMKNGLYEKQIAVKNVQNQLDRLILDPESAIPALSRLTKNISGYPSSEISKSTWERFLRELNAVNQTLSRSDITDESQEQLVSEQLTVKKTAADLDRQLAENIHQLSPGDVKTIATPIIGTLPKIIIYVFMAFALLSLLLFFYALYRILTDRSHDNQASLIHSQQNQEAILELLDVMTALSEGDLTVQARVSDDITGTLADSFNYSVEELRGLVSTVTISSAKVAEAVKESANVTDVLAKASSKQAGQITEATDTVMRVTEAMLDVSSQTSAAVDIAMSSTEVARSGSERVRSTIVGMDQIRDHIQETSKRIKRLGESSQEIGDIVELINDIADQTHILALNASIQASAAGDAGRGFAVVADEIQRLAERTGNATRRVENLVKTIQTDTNEAIFAMEKSTAEVVNGANLAERAGESLNEIESVSERLATLIQSVSKSAREVSTLGGKMKSSMDSIKDLTEQNVNSTKITTHSVEKINELANELRESVSGFKIK